jgi:hypothetical protein
VPVTTSFRPVSVDLTDVDIGDIQFRARPGKKWFAMVSGLAVAATVAGVAVTGPGWAQPSLTTVESYVSRAVHRAYPWTPRVAAAGPSHPADPVVPAANPSDTTLAPTSAAALPSDQTASSSADRFSPDLKQKLIDADKQRDLKAKARVRGIVPAASHLSAKNRFGGFTTGGNKFDPLNSAIP